MIRWIEHTTSEIAKVDKRLPVIIPIGLIEAHGDHLPLSVDLDTVNYFSERVAEQTGAILAPTLNYGFADEMREYPGTLGLRPQTLIHVVADIAAMFCFHGFHKQIYLSGHGANKLPVEMGFHLAWETCCELQPVYWNYWSEAGFNSIHHADKGETEIAMAVGIKTYPERAQDFKVTKPWHKIRSRHALDPESGGVNGEPTKANAAEGNFVRDEIVRILAKKVETIIGVR